MKPTEVHKVLKSIGATSLHHANTVATSCTFLEQGALLSRGYVETHGLAQTPQSSDTIDKQWGIWDRVFVDHVDIHHRAGRKKGPNAYGPVLFVMPLDVLLALPNEATIAVTKRNPVHWWAGQADADRWYGTADELAASIKYGDFDKMLVIDVPDGRVQFTTQPVRIALDDPQRNLDTGVNAFAHAKARLEAAAVTGGVQVSIESHSCRSECQCVSVYGKRDAKSLDLWFA